MSELRIYQDTKHIGRCRSCGATVQWAETVGGKRIPLNLSVLGLHTQHSALDGRVIASEIDWNIRLTRGRDE